MKVTYISAALNASGYSDAARNNIMAISRQGIEVEVVPLNFEKFKSDNGKLGDYIKGLVSHHPVADVQIIHTVPAVFDQYIDSQKYNIGYTVWETDRLPHIWVEQINRLNEVWVPTQYNHEVFKNSGVHIPITIIPHTFNRKLFEEDTTEVTLTGILQGDYVFYSIFQWLERKAPIQLLKAYLTEFRHHEKVCLVIKTYLFNPNDMAEKEKIRKVIEDVKLKLRLNDYPKIVLITDILSKPQVNAIHKTCDCCVSLHRAEGFGIVPVEAMMAGKPVIATDYSGTKDFIFQGTGYPIDYRLTPVYGMPFEVYTGDMLWADPDIMDVRSKMRCIFEDRNQAKGVGSAGRKWVDDNLSWEVIGEKMKNRLEEIYASR